ncbi:putative RNA methylase [Methanocaldococcus villosus KIN24-T80]|uniref:tRNA (guanine(10)-N(2))-dimethyltransferase n=1 Tax=Methanocaldococcus villosus KIN24-T80 TaxID=1069083 RepID=N6VRY7_9EURY|nr:TIGR01177 family methyltransferase [Methanocaldococcus villosus]ENN96640.1 putative RNA methylase [Methanocaldococcus villosus KIN24-T80]
MIGYVLSGDHTDLAFAELNALLDIFGYKGKIERLDRYVLTGESRGEEIVNRAGYINESHKIIYSYNYENFSLEGFLRDIERSLEIKINGSYAVRILKLHKDKSINSQLLEREIGAIIKRKTGAKVNLTNPENLIRVVILKDRIFIGNLIKMRDKKYFYENRPHLRKYFHPGSILPKLARAMVNLARVREGDIVLDPFCGTGGFLIEAGLIGAKLLGCDIDWRMARGSLINLEDYNLLDKVIKIECLDAKYVKDFLKRNNIEKVDAIITDPPYGISTAKKGEIEEIIKILPEVLKENGYFVFAYNKKINLNLNLEGLFKIPIHKQLVRYIHVYKKV